ncbi:MAG TPA: hypothetical protein VF796_03535 [Humisphaera sp.]
MADDRKKREADARARDRRAMGYLRQIRLAFTDDMRLFEFRRRYGREPRDHVELSTSSLDFMHCLVQQGHTRLPEWVGRERPAEEPAKRPATSGRPSTRKPLDTGGPDSASITAIEQRVRRASERLAVLTNRLRDLGYIFTDPPKALPGPATDAESDIDKLEQQFGPLPAALKTIWRIIGSVDFTGTPPVDWTGCEYPDPLVIYPPSVALADMADFLEAVEDGDDDGEGFPLPVSADYYHKAGVSGGMWYNVRLPSTSDDPPLSDSPYDTTLLGYLELALAWGGFPGLKDEAGHTWPVAAIRGSGGDDGDR